MKRIKVVGYRYPDNEGRELKTFIVDDEKEFQKLVTRWESERRIISWHREVTQ